MIQHSSPNNTCETTNYTDFSHISKDKYIEIQGATFSGEASPEKLASENKLLRSQITRLSQQNEALHNCWQSAIANHIESSAEARAWISRAAFKDSELAELRRQIEELKGHLNPKEEAA